MYMQCEKISYKFDVYFCEIKKQIKPADCHECSGFVQTHIYEHNING